MSAPVWKPVLSQGAVAGSLAALASTVALAMAGRRQAGSAAAPINAVSHWYWGDEAFQHKEADLSHTVVGYLTHHGAAVFWASLYAAVAHDQAQTRTVQGVLKGALATSALACFVDYRLTPKRLVPGYEQHLSRRALAGVYAAFAMGLAAGAWACRESYGERRSGAEPGVQPGAAPAAGRESRND